MKKKKPFRHWGEIGGVAIALAVMHVPLIFSRVYWGADFDPPKAGSFGSFIGGYFGTMFVIFSVGILAATFRNQRWSNEQATFESRFFELLKFHRENISEIAIGSDRTGRRVFVSMIREFRDTLKVVDHACTTVAPAYPNEKRLDLAYMAFYYGVGPNSTRVLKDAVEGVHTTNLVDAVTDRLTSVQDKYRALEKEIRASATDHDSAEYLIHQRWLDERLTAITYRPFDGHQSRLGHYYRHLFQMVKYLNENAPSGEDHEYAGILRAQLTNHEQALLCLNALSKIGAPWITEKYLIKYSLIKNIPKSFFPPETELDLEKRFPEIQFEFNNSASSEPNRSMV